MMMNIDTTPFIPLLRVCVFAGLRVCVFAVLRVCEDKIEFLRAEKFVFACCNLRVCVQLSTYKRILLYAFRNNMVIF